MPAAVAGFAVAAAVGSTAIGATVVIGTLTVAQIAGAVVSMAISSAMASREKDKAESMARSSYNASLRDITMVLDNPIVPRSIVIGEARTSGPVWPWFTHGGLGEVHSFGVILAGHECEAIPYVFFNEDLVTLDVTGVVIAPAKYCRADGSGLFTVRRHLGGAAQVAAPELMSAAAASGNPAAWDATRVGTGICYLTVDMVADFNALGDIGVPKVSALVLGVNQVLDTRTGLRGYTTNPPLLARWFLVDCPYSPKTLATEIDVDQCNASANVSDEMIAFSATVPGLRYSASGLLSCDEIPLANLRHILDAMDGDALPISGKWQLIAGYFQVPTLTIDQDKLSEEDIDIAPFTQKDDLFNLVTGKFYNPADGYQFVSYPDITNLTYQEEDGGEPLPQAMDYVLVNHPMRCQMIGWQRLSRARNGQTVRLGTTFRGYDTSPLKNVNVSLVEVLGPETKVFSVRQRDFSAPGLTYTLQETGPEVWAWDYTKADAVVDIPNTSFPDVNVVPAPGVPFVTESLYETSGSAGVRSRVSLACSEIDYPFTYGYLFEYKLSSEPTVWTQVPLSVTPAALIDDLAPSIYNFRVRAESTTGRRGAYSGVATYEILGLTARPANVGGLSVLAIAGRADASWNLQPDLDVRIGGRIVFRHTPLMSGAVWENGIILNDFNGDAVSAQLPLLSGTYMAKAMDSSTPPNFSAAMAPAVLTESQVTGFTTVATITESPGFPGVKTGTYVDGSTLKIAGATLWDSMGLIDSTGFIDSLGGVASSGEYAFASVFNFGAVLSRRLSVILQALAIDAGDLFDDRGPIDDWGLVDGGEINDTDATVFYSLTQTDPAGAPVWGPWVPFMSADVTAWGVRLKLLMESGSPTHNLALSTLTVVAKSSP
jgi:hypothetical protein